MNEWVSKDGNCLPPKGCDEPMEGGKRGSPDVNDESKGVNAETPDGRDW